MIEIILSIVAIVVSSFVFTFNIFQYKKSLPHLKFKYSNSNYFFPNDKNKKTLFGKGTFNMEILITNSGVKEVSIVDIFFPIKQLYTIRAFKENSKKIYHLLNKSENNKLSFHKDHMPLLNCSQIKIELSFILDSEEKDHQKETEYIWNKLHSEDFIILTSDNKKYRVNANKLLLERYKRIPPAIFTANQKGMMLSITAERRTRHPNLGVRFVRKIKKTS